MSRIITNNLRHNDATADNLTLDGTGNITAPGNLTTSGNLSVTGTTTLTNDLNVDSGTLFVDASTNNVGFGTTNPERALHVSGNLVRFDNPGGAPGILLLDRTSGSEEGFRMVVNVDSTGSLSIEDMGTAVSGGGTERLRITNNGTIQLRNSPGIDFSQLQTNAAGMTSETLDSYEEGTWTPTINTGYTVSYNLQAGRYIKVGKLVTVWLVIDTQTISGSSSDTYAEVEGLPFTVRNAPYIDTAFTVGWEYNLSNSVDHAYASGNTNYIVLLGPNSSGFRTHWSPVQVWNNNDTRIAISGSYWTDQ